MDILKIINKYEEYILICLLAIAFLGTNLIQVLVSAFIVVYLFFKKEHYSYFSLMDLRRMICWYLLPCIVIHLYTIILSLFGVFDSNIVSTNLITYLPIILGITMIYHYGGKGCIYVLMGLFLAFMITFIPKFFQYGIEGVLNAFKSFFLLKDNDGGSVFELDDLVLSAGYFIILFLNSAYLKNWNKKLIAFLYLFIFIMGGKRIDVLASLIVLFFFLCIKKIKKIKTKKLCLIIGYFILFCGILLIVLLSSPNFLNFLVDKLGINLMSRNYFWDGIMKTTSFSPLFLGYGRGHVKIWMLDNYAPFQNVHCDYIKMFVELGTIGYILWLYYYLIFLQKKFWDTYGSSVGIVYFFTMIFTFILFLTDNTESYFICGLVRVVIPIALISINKKTKNRAGEICE